MNFPETVEVEPPSEPIGSVVWLHGLGADGHDFEPIVPELRLQELPLRFVFPHAPVRPVTINGGMAMRAWYDIISLDRNGAQDEDGIRASSGVLDALIEREIERGIDPSKIVVAGFSQGGAIALHTALRATHKLAGLLALSTWLPLSHTLQSEVSSQAASLPIFLAHGTQDPMLPIDFGHESRATLESLGFEVEWHEYPMGHGVCPQEIGDIRSWLMGVFAGG